MTDDEILNERLKLLANWGNTLATGILTIGSFIPAAQFIYGILPDTTEASLVWISAVVCIPVGISIHLAGQWILGGLR